MLTYFPPFSKWFMYYCKTIPTVTILSVSGNLSCNVYTERIVYTNCIETYLKVLSIVLKGYIIGIIYPISFPTLLYFHPKLLKL